MIKFTHFVVNLLLDLWMQTHMLRCHSFVALAGSDSDLDLANALLLKDVVHLICQAVASFQVFLRLREH